MKKNMIRTFTAAILMALLCTARVVAQEDYMICEDYEVGEEMSLPDAVEETLPAAGEDTVLAEDISAEELFAQSDDDEDDDDSEDDEDEEDEDTEETEKTPEVISQVSIKNVIYSAPAYRKPTYTAKAEYGNVEVVYEGWTCEDGSVNYSVRSAAGDDDDEFQKFEEGKTYRYKICIACLDNDTFSADATFKVGGMNATGGVFNKSRTRYTVDGIYSETSRCIHELVTKTVKATCTTNGAKYRTCRYCGMSAVLETYRATGHKYEEDEEHSQDPTCTEDGYHTMACENCGLSYSFTLPKTGHQFAEDEDASKEPTCETAGVKVEKCENEGCSAKRTTRLAPLGHLYKLDIEEKATKDEEGVYCYTCAREDCGAQQKNHTIFPFKKIKLAKTKYACTGSAIKPSLQVVDSMGKTIDPKYYEVVYKSNKNVGTATVHITFSTFYSGTLQTTFSIVKGSQSISAAGSSFTLKKSDLKKKAAVIALNASAKTKLSYSSSSKYVKVSKGKIHVKKGTPKGTYTVTIKAASSKNFKEATRKIKVKVK